MIKLIFLKKIGISMDLLDLKKRLYDISFWRRNRVVYPLYSVDDEAKKIAIERI